MKPKDIGTRAETAVERYLVAHGFPWAHRRGLTGSQDKADIWMAPDCVASVKAGKAAENASDKTISEWLIQAANQADNAGANGYLLITKRRGFGQLRVGEWWAHFLIERANLLPIPARTQLHNAVRMYRAMGYGLPLGGDDEAQQQGERTSDTGPVVP